MNLKKLLLGGIAGGIVFFLLGWLIYGKLLMGFMTAHPGLAVLLAIVVVAYVIQSTLIPINNPTMPPVTNPLARLVTPDFTKM